MARRGRGRGRGAGGGRGRGGRMHWQKTAPSEFGALFDPANIPAIASRHGGNAPPAATAAANLDEAVLLAPLDEASSLRRAVEGSANGSVQASAAAVERRGPVRVVRVGQHTVRTWQGALRLQRPAIRSEEAFGRAFATISQLCSSGCLPARSEAGASGVADAMVQCASVMKQVVACAEAAIAYHSLTSAPKDIPMGQAITVSTYRAMIESMGRGKMGLSGFWYEPVNVVAAGAFWTCWPTLRCGVQVQ